MTFVDYYAVLNLPQDASEQEVNEAYFSLLSLGTLTLDEIDAVSQARELLSDWRERMKYDQKFGFPMIIQTESMPMMNVMSYELARPKEAISILMSIKESFIDFVLKKTELTWQEAEKEHYGYELEVTEPPYLVLRFQQERERAAFAKKLVDERKIKA